jgi:predicted nucleic acid-binding protein
VDVTLSLGASLVEKAREIAADRGVTPDQLIGHHLKTCMSAPDFVLTNALLPAYVPSDRRKQLIAHDLVRKALAGYSISSTQVLAEYASALLHKVAAAERGGCRRIWSEDLNAGRKYFGIVVENPFLSAR